MKKYDTNGSLQTSLTSSLTTKMRAHMNGVDQTGVVTVTWTLIELDIKSFDTLDEFDTTTHRFTAKNAGYYLINASIRMLNVLDLKYIRLAIYRNGANMDQCFRNSGDSAQDPMASISDIHYLDVGDYVEMKIYHNEGTDGIVDGPSAYTYMSITRV